MDPELRRYLKTMVKLAIIVLALIVVYLLFSFIFPMLGNVLSLIPVLFLPFIVAILLAVISEPIVNVFEERLKLKRSWSVGVTLALLVGGFISFISLIIMQITAEVSAFYPKVISQSDAVINRFVTAISEVKLFYLQLNLPVEIQDTLQNSLERGIRILSGFMDSSINILVNVLTMLPGLFIFLMIATVATFFIIKDRALIRNFVLQFIPRNARNKTRDIVGELFKAFTGFVKAYSILISITAIITMIALQLMGIDYVLTIGIFVGLLDILPVLGPGAFFVPWILFEFFAGDPGRGMGLLIIYIIISTVRQFLEPKIIGDNIGLHPLATLISLYVGLKLGGVMGMVLGPVTVVIIIASYKAGVFEGLNWRKDP